MIKVNQVTDGSYSVLGLTNSSKVPTTIYYQLKSFIVSYMN